MCRNRAAKTQPKPLAIPNETESWRRETQFHRLDSRPPALPNSPPFTFSARTIHIRDFFACLFCLPAFVSGAQFFNSPASMHLTFFYLHPQQIHCRINGEFIGIPMQSPHNYILKIFTHKKKFTNFTNYIIPDLIQRRGEILIRQ